MKTLGCTGWGMEVSLLSIYSCEEMGSAGREGLSSNDAVKMEFLLVLPLL